MLTLTSGNASERSFYFVIESHASRGPQGVTMEADCWSWKANDGITICVSF